MITETMQKKLRLWQEAKERAVQAKRIIEEERDLRNEVYAMFFDVQNVKEGKNKHPEIPLIATVKPSFKITDKELVANFACLRLKPELDKRTYNKLTKEEKEEISAGLDIKFGTPELEFLGDFD